ncbi:hypothetical protein ACIP10_25430 [Streptomyces galbus]|uniref:hypothetical protein n=1 Tax=Streptomyces galbus TaxID=33898 RepID=UPI0037BA9289
MKQSGASALLQGAVQDLASGVASALRGGGRTSREDLHATVRSTSDLDLAAARVLGADLLLPAVLDGTAPTGPEVDLARRAFDAYPPPVAAAPTVAWSHWALGHTLRRVGAPSGPVPEPGPEPDASWLTGAPWPSLTHHLAVLAPLALPGQDCALARLARSRTLDIARGFVRAIRRRDWYQAAGAGRWLAVLPDVPHTLGLPSGLDFVELMGGEDARVLLQVRAARLIGSGVSV